MSLSPKIFYDPWFGMTNIILVILFNFYNISYTLMSSVTASLENSFWASSILFCTIFNLKIQFPAYQQYGIKHLFSAIAAKSYAIMMASRGKISEQRANVFR